MILTGVLCETKFGAELVWICTENTTSVTAVVNSLFSLHVKWRCVCEGGGCGGELTFAFRELSIIFLTNIVFHRFLFVFPFFLLFFLFVSSSFLFIVVFVSVARFLLRALPSPILSILFHHHSHHFMIVSGDRDNGEW